MFMEIVSRALTRYRPQLIVDFVIPEPSTVALPGFGLLSLLARRRGA